LALANPVINTNRREEKPRDRVLSDAELTTIWQASRDDDFGVITKLLVLTGQRANEIAGLRWTLELKLMRAWLQNYGWTLEPLAFCEDAPVWVLDPSSASIQRRNPICARNFWTRSRPGGLDQRRRSA
jgi:hypothetical protein